MMLKGNHCRVCYLDINNVRGCREYLQHSFIRRGANHINFTLYNIPLCEVFLLEEMNMKKLIVLLSLLLVLVGCSVSEPVEREPLIVGMECNYAPFNWTQNFESEESMPLSDGTYCDGYDVAIARIIADEIDRDLVIHNYAVFTGLLEAAKVGDIDLIIAGMTDTAERRQEVAFSTIYYTSDMVLVVRKDGAYSDATSLADFNGATVSAQIGTIHDQLIDQIPNVNHSQPLDSFPSLTTAVNSTAIDAFVSEKPVAMAITDSNSSLTYIEFDPSQGFEVDQEEVTVSIGMAKEEVELLSQVNAVLANISSEERDEIMHDAIQRQPSSDVMMPEGFIAGIIFLLQNNANQFINGIIATLLIALVGTVFGLIIGLGLALLRNLETNPHDNILQRTVKWIIVKLVSVYIQVFRGTPMMVQAILLYYGLHSAHIPISALMSAFVIISINTAAYMAEILRSSIQAIDPGQREAALGIGMSNTQAMIYIILPQALRNSIPSIGNEFIVNLKDSSVLNVITVSELFFQANRLNGIYYRQLEPFTIVALIYLGLTLIATKVLNIVEHKLDHPKSSGPSSITRPMDVEGETL